MNVIVHVMSIIQKKTFSIGKKSIEEKLQLDLLSELDKNGKASQRYLSDQLSIAVGLTNTYLNKCIKKGLVKVKQIPKARYFYYLTPKGFSEKSRLTFNYLTNSLDFFRQAKQECMSILNLCKKKKYTKIGIIGEGDLVDIAELLAKQFTFRLVKINRNELKKIRQLYSIDALIILEINNSQKLYNDCIKVFNYKNILVPELLRISKKKK